MIRKSAIILALLFGLAAAAGAESRPVIVVRSHAIIWESLQANNIVESNETITCAIALQNLGERFAPNVTASLAAINGILPLTAEQSFGTLLASNEPVTREFTFTVNVGVGRIVQAELIINTNGVETGRCVFDIPVGDNAVVFERLNYIDVPHDKVATVGVASEYPSTIHVSDLPGTITGVRVTLHNFEHEFMEDLNILLVAPSGTNVMLMSDCGGYYATTNVNLTFDSAITNWLPTLGVISSGTYSASDYNIGNGMEPPAPTAPAHGTFMGQFKRLNPNGDWNLYLFDHLYEDIGVLRGGWSLALTILKPPTLSIQDNGDGRVRITVSGTGNRSFLIDYSTNLVNWQTMGQLPATDTAAFFDTPAGQPQRFYRTRRTNP